MNFPTRPRSLSKPRKGRPEEFEAAFDFTPGRLYRIEIASPTFVPDATLHNGDTRTLGLAVFSIRISR